MKVAAYFVRASRRLAIPRRLEAWELARSQPPATISDSHAKTTRAPRRLRRSRSGLSGPISPLIGTAREPLERFRRPWRFQPAATPQPGGAGRVFVVAVFAVLARRVVVRG